MDLNSAVGRKNGVPQEKLDALPRFREDAAFSDRERLVLDYAEKITYTDRDVDDALFGRLQREFTIPELVELTEIIAMENMVSRFNHAFHIEAMGFNQM